MNNYYEIKSQSMRKKAPLIATINWVLNHQHSHYGNQVQDVAINQATRQTKNFPADTYLA